MAGNWAAGCLQAVVGDDARVVQRKRIHARLLHQTGSSTRRQSTRHMRTGIDCRTRPSQKTIASANLTAVGAQCAGHLRLQPARGLLRCVQLQHQNVSSTGSVTTKGLTAMSGATPRTRSVCCTVWLNTGAATSPPKY